MENINTYKMIKILWTGGFDSTYRILQLSKFSVKIQPYYVTMGRLSEKTELLSITQNTSLILTHATTKALLFPTIIVKKEDKNKYTDIIDAFSRLKKNYDPNLADQYLDLACFAREHKGIEISTHEGGPIPLIFKYGSFLKKTDTIIGDYLVIDEEKTDKDVHTVFGDFHYPIVLTTKLQMKNYYINNRHTDIMKNTWFCPTPIKGKPCGLCNPCDTTINEGLNERFSKTALRRNKFRKFLFKRNYLLRICRPFRKFSVSSS